MPNKRVMIEARHFLTADMKSGCGNEPAWAIGEMRTVKGKLGLCVHGYHSSPSWYDALQYAPGAVACKVLVSEPEAKDDSKQVSRRRLLVAAINAEGSLRLWGCECAERALQRERDAGREPDQRSWHAVAVARLFIEGKASNEELEAAREAAWAATGEAAREAWEAAREAAREAWEAAREAAREAAWEAAREAARAATGAATRAAWEEECNWQRRRLDELIEAAFNG